MTKQAVLLMAYGSPVRLDQVEPYYTDIRRGNPPSPALLEELVGRYRAIGGGSPLSRIVEEQRGALEAELVSRGTPMPVYAGMRHIEPRIAEVVRRMADDGIEESVAIALAPQASMSVAAYRRAVDGAAAAIGERAPRFRIVESWCREPDFIEALAETTDEALGRFPDPDAVRLMFSAHSLPQRVVDAGDTYPDELAVTARLVADLLGRDTYDFAYQSAGRTEEPWLGPDILAEIRRLAAEGVTELVVSPVGFIADHLEVLYDIDIEAQGVARPLGIHLERPRMLNDDPLLISALAGIVGRTLPLSEPADAPAPAAGRP
jgi:ferrochelatase